MPVQSVNKWVLVVDDRADVRMSAVFLLEDNGYQVREAESPGQAKESLSAGRVDLVLLDMNYSRDTTSGEEGLAFLQWLKAEYPDLPLVAMTAWSNVELAVKAMQCGAGDFVEKPWKNQRLLQVISQQLALRGLEKQNQILSQRLADKQPQGSGYQWRSPVMTELLQQLKNVASTDVNILLTGENGSGKSQLARWVHQHSAVAEGPFISVNMGAISETLFESEMFGHKKGAFTDARTERIGRFELASQGTLFLDEIGNIPLSQQPKLLRVLESGEFEMLGSSRTQQASPRIVSASNADFSRLIGEERFREDLFYRLNTLEFRVPALKERTEDIATPAEHFIQRCATKYNKASLPLSDDAKALLEKYHWPGNVRELSHVIERAFLLGGGERLNSADLHLHQKPAEMASGLPLMTLEQAERQLIAQALSQTGSNVTQAAKLLGLTKSSLYRRLDKYSDLQ